MIIIRLNRPKFMKLLLVHHISYIWNILGKPIIGIVLLYVLFINPNINVIYAKIPYTAWVNQYSGTGNDNDVIYDIAVDQHDNIYVTGESFVAGNYQDFTTIKYRFNGDTAWVRTYNGPGDSADNIVYSVEVDSSGNVYVGGSSYSGPSTRADYALVKYDSTGYQEWVKRYNGPGNLWDDIIDVALDPDGNIYVTGQSVGSGTNYDIATIKYFPSGNVDWLRRFGSSNGDYGYNIALDPSNNVFVSGCTSPGGVYEHRDIVVLKYDPSGTLLWNKQYNGTADSLDLVNDMTVDQDGNCYITGTSVMTGSFFDFITIKYRPNGDTAWVRYYNGPGNNDDDSKAIEVDRNGNVYITGHSQNAALNNDYATIKYDSSGNEQWVRRYNGSGNWFDYAYDLAIDSSFNVYVTGTSYSGSATKYDVATIKYDSSGTVIWTKKYARSGDGSDYANVIAINSKNEIFTAGATYVTGENDNFLTLMLSTLNYINNLNDNGSGSLRWAIDSCNFSAEADTIIFNISGPINLISPLPQFATGGDCVLGSTAPDGAFSVILNGSGLGSGSGLRLLGSSNLIEGLVIHGFPDNGIEINGSARYNTITNNLIYNNGLLGIDLGDDGVTLNDADDGDTGPNDLLNYPEIDSVFMNPDSSFRVYGRAANNGIIEFFVAYPAGDDSKPADPSGHGEAWLYIGSDTADGSGNFEYEISNAIAYFSLITTTCTDASGNTSEFSPNFRLVPTPLIIVGYSPINLHIIDPAGDSIGKYPNDDYFNTIGSNATYDDITTDSITIQHPLEGEYIIIVYPQGDPPPGALYTIGIRIDGSQQAIIVENQYVPVSGTADTLGYEVIEGYHFSNGDPTRDNVINLIDILYLIDYLYGNPPGPAPYPLTAGDANCDQTINLIDILYLISHLYGTPPGAAPCDNH